MGNRQERSTSSRESVEIKAAWISGRWAAVGAIAAAIVTAILTQLLPDVRVRNGTPSTDDSPATQGACAGWFRPDERGSLQIARLVVFPEGPDRTNQFEQSLVKALVDAKCPVVTRGGLYSDFRERSPGATELDRHLVRLGIAKVLGARIIVRADPVTGEIMAHHSETGEVILKAVFKPPVTVQ